MDDKWICAFYRLLCRARDNEDDYTPEAIVRLLKTALQGEDVSDQEQTDGGAGTHPTEASSGDKL